MVKIVNSSGLSPFNAPLYHLDHVDSTNNYAAELVATGEVAHGTVILADEQTNGRGQRDRIWQSASRGDLTFSLILKPEQCSAEQGMYFSYMAAVAVVRALARLGLEDSSVKWPNDVMVNDSKIAGILIENTMIASDIEQVIIGIGLNIHNAPRSPEYKAISLNSIVNKQIKPAEALRPILEEIKRYYLAWLHAGKQNMTDDSLLWKRNIWSDFLLDGKKILAKPLTISVKGRLMVELQSGEVKAFGTERLRHIR